MRIADGVRLVTVRVPENAGCVARSRTRSRMRRTTGRSSAAVDLAEREVVAVDGAALAGPRDRVVVVLSGQQAHVVHLRDATREQLDRARCDVSVVIPIEGRVVGAVQLVHVDAVVGRGQDPVDVPSAGPNMIGEGGHLRRPRMSSRSGRTGMPSWQSSIVNWRSGDRARCAARPTGVRRPHRVKDEARQHEVVRPIASCRELRGWRRRRGPRAERSSRNGRRPRRASRGPPRSPARP